jgi:xylulokinase
MSNVLAYDFGTGGIKASVYRPDGECLASHFATYETLYPRPGWHEQDVGDWWKATVEATRLLLEAWDGSADSVAAIGISGHSLGLVPLDADGALLRRNAIIWSDSRPDAQPERFFKKVDEERWYLATGNGFPAPLYTVFKIMWLRDNEPEVFAEIGTVLGSKDYVNYRMTGVMKTDYSYASGCGVWDLAGWRYSDELVGAADVPRSIFPEAVAASDVIGTLTGEAAGELGLPKRVRVVAGGVDNSCMALGARAYRDGDAYNSMGSSSWIAVTGAEPLLNVASRPYVFAHLVPGKFTSAIGVFSTGSSFRWLREQLCTNLDVAAERDSLDTYEFMLKLAAESPLGAGGVMFLPSMAGGSSLDPSRNVRGAFVQLDLGSTQADLCRAAVEGIAMSQAVALRELESLRPLSDEILAVGGGARSDFWMQIYADMYGKRMVRSQAGQQAAALGAAAAAFVGIGEWPDYSPVGEVHRIIDVRTPVAGNAELYEKRMRIFERLNAHLGDIGDLIMGQA